MYLKKSTYKNGRTFISIVQGYWDSAKKQSRTQTIKKIGYLDELMELYADPIAHFENEVALMNLNKEAEQTVSLSINPEETLSQTSLVRKNFGYAALSKVYHELGLHSFFLNHTRKSKAAYDTNSIMKLLVYSKILNPCSKQVTFENRDVYFEKFDFTLDDIYHCLTTVNNLRDKLQLYLHEKVKQQYGRKSAPVYYNVTNYYLEIDTQEHQPDLIVQMGLYMDDMGIPISYQLFPGRQNNCATLVSAHAKIKREDNIEEAFKITQNDLKSRAGFSQEDQIQAHFLTCFIALMITRVLQHKLGNQYASGQIIECLHKAACSHISKNNYVFDHYDEVLAAVGAATGIDFSKKFLRLADIRKVFEKGRR